MNDAEIIRATLDDYVESNAVQLEARAALDRILARLQITEEALRAIAEPIHERGEPWSPYQIAREALDRAAE